MKNPLWALRTFSGSPSTATRFLREIVQFNDTLAQIIAFGSSDGSVEVWALPDINSVDKWMPMRIWGGIQCHQQAITDLSWQQCNNNSDSLMVSSAQNDIDEKEDAVADSVNRNGMIKSILTNNLPETTTINDDAKKKRAQLLPVGDAVTYGVHELSFDTCLAEGASRKISGGEAVLVISSSDGYVSFLTIPLPVMTTIGR